MRTRSLVVAGLVSALLVLSAGCGGSDDTPRPAAASERSEAVVTLPTRLLGLEVEEENVASVLETVRGTYFDGIGLYSFREDDELLRATLQIGRFNELAEVDDPSFRRRIIARLGSSSPEELWVGEKTVFLTSGNEQHIMVWFEGDSLFVLSVRSDYPFPRTLLRRLLEMQPRSA